MKMFRHRIFLAAMLTFAVTACRYDELIDTTASMSAFDDSNLSERQIGLDVNELGIGVSTKATASEETSEEEELASEKEKIVKDLWVFQYDKNGDLLISPRYYTASEDNTLQKSFNVLLKDGVESYIYVVANTRDSTWASNSGKFGTIDLLKEEAISYPFPIVFGSELEDNPIPMEGVTDGTVIPDDGTEIVVPVTRMYAKLKIKVELGDILYEHYDDIEIYYVDVGNIPLYCRVGTLASEQGNGGEGAVSFPADVAFTERPFSDESEGEDEEYPYVLYVPENLGGMSSNTSITPELKTSTAPSGALKVTLRISYKEKGSDEIHYLLHTAYPGGNDYNNYNVRRNDVYRVTLSVGYPLTETITGSANVFVGYAGDVFSFYPYYCEDSGGGYTIGDYLDPDDETGEKVIDHVAIIWQDKDCIGDNTNGDLVWISEEESDAAQSIFNYKVYVRTNNEGNALVGAYNSYGDIIWSWHIWVRQKGTPDPTNIANALLYYTYSWDENGIYSFYKDAAGNETAYPRVAGYPIMSCNLGALQDEPNWGVNPNFGHHGYATDSEYYTVQALVEGDGIARTYGLLYQWGRKDPFPPMIKTDGAIGNNKTGLNTGYYVHDYDDDHTGYHYGNDNKTILHKTAYDENGPTYSGAVKESEGYVFYTHIAAADEGVRYAISHPTVFLCGTSEIARCLDDTYRLEKADSTWYTKRIRNYIYKGAWSEEDHDNQEWGATETTEALKWYDSGLITDAGTNVVLYDNFGDKKSIFDPCPYGWRVAPGELWLGFMKNGLNAFDDPLSQNKATTEAGLSDDDGSFDNINYDPEKSCLLGMSLYLGSEWRTGLTSWFPTQGFRLPDGTGYRVGGCGNYANANADSEYGSTYDRINVIHVHDRVQNFKAFENQLQYTVKASANSIRCIRDLTVN